MQNIHADVGIFQFKFNFLLTFQPDLTEFKFLIQFCIIRVFINYFVQCINLLFQFCSLFINDSFSEFAEHPHIFFFPLNSDLFRPHDATIGELSFSTAMTLEAAALS